MRSSRFTIALLLISAAAQGQEQPSAPQPAPVTSAFDVTFQPDERTGFDVKGEVKWQPQNCRLSPGASLSRKVVYEGPAELTFDFEPHLGKDDEASICQLAFRSVKHGDLLVEWRTHPKGHSPAGEIVFLDRKTGLLSTTTVLRVLKTGAKYKGRWKIRQADRALSITLPDGKEINAASFQFDFFTTITEVTWQQQGAAGVLRRWSLVTQPPLEWTPAQIESRKNVQGLISLTEKLVGAKSFLAAEQSLKLMDAELAKLPAEFVAPRAEYLKLRGQLHVAKGEFAQGAQQFQQAEETFAKVTESSHPFTSDVRIQRAYSLLESGEQEEGSRLLHQAINSLYAIIGPNPQISAAYERSADWADAQKLPKLVINSLQNAAEIHTRWNDSLAGTSNSRADECRLRLRLAKFCQRMGDLALAEREFTALVERADKYPPRREDHFDYRLLLAHNQLAQQRFEQANQTAKELKEFVAQKFPPDHYFMVHTLNLLAVIAAEQNRFQDESELHEEALAVAARTKNQDGCWSVALANQSARHVNRGQFRAAVAVADQALEVENRYPTDDWVRAWVLQMLVTAHSRAGNIEKASEFYPKASELMERSRGKNDPDVLTFRIQWASSLRNHGRLDAAERILQDTIERTTKLPYEWVRAKVGLVQVLRTRGELGQAEEILSKLLPADDTGLNPPNDALGNAWIERGRVADQQGRGDHAEVYFDRGITILSRFWGPEAVDTLSAREDRARSAEESDRFSKAQEHAEKLLDSLQKIGQQDSAAAASVHEILGTALARQGRYKEGERVLQAGLTIAQLVLGPRDTQVALIRNGLATVETLRGNYQASLSHLEAALSILEESGGKSSPMVAQTLVDLADVYRQLQRYADAEQSARRSLAIWRETWGSESDLALTAQAYYAMHLIRIGKEQEAHDQAEESLNKLRRRYPDGNSFVVQVLLHQAAIAEDRHDFTSAITARQQALEVGHKHGRFATVFVQLNRKDLAIDLQKLGKRLEAIKVLEDGVAAARTEYGDKHPRVVACLIDLAYFLADTGEEPSATRVVAEILAIAPDGNDLAPLLRADLCTARAELHASADEYDQAELLARQALEIFAASGLKPDASKCQWPALILTRLLRKRGDFTEAERLARATLGSKLTGTPADRSHGASCLRELARIRLDQNLISEAEPLVLQACTIDTDLGLRDIGLIGSLIELGNLYRSQRRWNEAEQAIRRAIELCGDRDKNATLARGYVDLGKTLRRRGDLVGAQKATQEALTIYAARDNQDARKINVARSCLASILMDQGKLAEAQSEFEQVVAYFKDRKYDRESFSATQHNLANCLFAQGKYAEAEALFFKSVETRRQYAGPGDLSELMTKQGQAMAANAKGDRRAAIRLWKEVAAGYPLLRAKISHTGLERNFTIQFSPYQHLAVAAAQEGQPKEAWQWMEQALAAGFRDEVAARQIRGADQAGQQRMAAIFGELESIDSILAQPAEKQKQNPQQLQDRKIRLQAELSQLQSELVRQHGVAAGDVFELARIQAQIPADAALLGWQLDGKHLYGVVLRRSGDPHWILARGSGPDGRWTAGDAELLSRLSAAIQSTKTSLTEIDQLRKAVRERLIVPLASAFQAQGELPPVRRLVFLSAGQFAGVPLDVVESEYQVSTIPSASIFAWQGEQVAERLSSPQRSLKLLAVGDPVYGVEVPPTDKAAIQLTQLARERGDVWGPLPGTRIEVESLAALFAARSGHATKLVGNDASTAKLAEIGANDGLAQFTHLHFATHGRAEGRDLFDAALILSQAGLDDPATSIEKGKGVATGELTAEEVYRRWNLNADLVVLSACQSGLGRQTEGEGQVGFPHALLLAGARSVVSSHWRVDDSATALLMRRFYENLLGSRVGLSQPMTKGAALHEAKKWLRSLDRQAVDQAIAGLPQANRGTKVTRLSPPAPRTDQPATTAERPYAHPYYWAAFQLTGRTE